MAISTAIDQSAVARVVGIKTEFKNLRGGRVVYLPQRVAVFGLINDDKIGEVDLSKRQVTQASEVGSLYGFGSQLHLACLQLLPPNGDGVGTVPVTVYPMQHPITFSVSSGSITPTGTAVETSGYRFYCGGVRSQQFILDPADDVAAMCQKIVAAINAELDMPVLATTDDVTVTLEAKWGGLAGDDISIVLEGDLDNGVAFGISNMAGGIGSPDIESKLAEVGDVWETLLLNCSTATDEDAMDAFQQWGEGRWGALTRKPAVAVFGTVESDQAQAIVIPETRKSDRVNVQIPFPGSRELPFVLAARALARIAPVANNNPPRDYGSLKVDFLEPGTDAEQWLYPARDAAVKGGSSTTEVKDGVINLSDTITFYHPEGDPTPAYRYLCDIVKLQNTIFNIDLIFATDEWDGAPLIPDDQPTVNREAKKPKMAVAEVSSLLDQLGLEAIISDPEAAKQATVAAISSQNPKRLDVATTVQLSGNTNIISIDLDFGFYFGTQTVVA